MKAMRNLAWLAGLLTIAALALPGRAQAQQRTGVEIWSVVCGRCHTIQPPERYTTKDWASIMSQMKINARLTDDQAAAVLQFLQQGAMRPPAQQQDAVPDAPAFPPVDARPSSTTSKPRDPGGRAPSN